MRNRVDLRNEHELVRKNVGFYDFTHETLEVTGKDARELLENIYVNDVAKLKPGNGLYTTMLNEDGKI